jgi:L-fuconolactonase
MAAMRIDAHQHFWEYSPEEYGWIDDRMDVIRRSFGPRDLKPLLRAHGFDGSVAVQARQHLEETEYLLRLADEDGSVLGVVGWVDLCGADVGSQLERFAAHPRFVGVRHIVQDEPDDRFLMREEFLRGVALLRDLTYDILVYPSQLPAALDFVERFPQQRLVIDHIAKPPIARAELEPWASQMRQLAEASNVWCKVSGMVTETDWQGWKREDFTPYLDVVFEAFGAARIMVGSDWPVCTLAASYDQVMDIVTTYIEPLSEEDKAAVLGNNAERFYKLEATTHAL